MAKMNELLRQQIQEEKRTEALVSREINKLFVHESKTISTAADLGDIAGLVLIADNLETESLQRYGASIHNIYCAKTGQIIGQRSAHQVRLIAEMHEISDISHLLQYITACSTAAHWLQTDGLSLARLAKIDPIGYFVYAASICMRPYAVGYNNAKKVFESNRQEQLYNQQKIALWHALNQYENLDDIHRANQAWAVFLAQFNPKEFNSKVVFPFTSLIEFAQTDVIHGVSRVLKQVSTNAYKQLLTSRRRVEWHSKDLAAVVKELYEGSGGRSNFRAQISNSNVSNRARVELDFATEMVRAGVVGGFLSNSTTTLQIKINPTTKTSTTPSVFNGAAFKGFNLAIKKAP